MTEKELRKKITLKFGDIDYEIINFDVLTLRFDSFFVIWIAGKRGFTPSPVLAFGFCRYLEYPWIMVPSTKASPCFARLCLRQGKRHRRAKAKNTTLHSIFHVHVLVATINCISPHCMPCKGSERWDKGFACAFGEGAKQWCGFHFGRCFAPTEHLRCKARGTLGSYATLPWVPSEATPSAKRWVPKARQGEVKE